MAAVGHHGTGFRVEGFGEPPSEATQPASTAWRAWHHWSGVRELRTGPRRRCHRSPRAGASSPPPPRGEFDAAHAHALGSTAIASDERFDGGCRERPARAGQSARSGLLDVEMSRLVSCSTAVRPSATALRADSSCTEAVSLKRRPHRSEASCIPTPRRHLAVEPLRQRAHARQSAAVQGRPVTRPWRTRGRVTRHRPAATVQGARACAQSVPYV